MLLLLTGAALGATPQPYDPQLQAFAELAPSGGEVPYFSSPTAMSLLTFSSLGRTLASVGSVGAAQTALQLVPGVDVQPYSANLDVLSDLGSPGWVHYNGPGSWTVGNVPQSDITLDHDLAALEGLSGTGWAKRTAIDTWTLSTPSASDVGAVPTSRSVSTTAPLTGGGTLSSDLTLAVSAATTSSSGVVQLAASGGTTASTVVQATDSRLSDSRSPTAHASTHASGGSDPVTLAESQTTGLVADLAAKVPTTRTISTTSPMAGGGALSGDLTLSVATMVASGASHAAGLAPDPGASPGTTKFLREDATWAAPTPSGIGAQAVEAQTVTTWSGTTADVNLAGYTDVQAELTGSTLLQGVVAEAAGTSHILRNTSPYLLVLQMSASAESTAARRFQTEDKSSSHLCMMPGDVARIVYDGAASRWTVVPIRSLWWTNGRGQVRWVHQTTSTSNTDNQIAWVAGSGTFTTPTPSTASLMESKYRQTITSGSSSTNVAGQGAALAYMLPSTGSIGGFGALFGWGFESLSDTTMDAAFGLSANTSPTGSNPYSTLANDAFFCFDNGDSHYSFCYNDGSGSATKADLGAGYVPTAKELYRSVIWWDPSQSAKLSYAIWDETTTSTAPVVGDVATNLPAAGIRPLMITTNRTAAARSIMYDEWALWTP